MAESGGRLSSEAVRVGRPTAQGGGPARARRVAWCNGAGGASTL